MVTVSPTMNSDVGVMPKDIDVALTGSSEENSSDDCERAPTPVVIGIDIGKTGPSLASVAILKCGSFASTPSAGTLRPAVLESVMDTGVQVDWSRQSCVNVMLHMGAAVKASSAWEVLQDAVVKHEGTEVTDPSWKSFPPNPGRVREISSPSVSNIWGVNDIVTSATKLARTGSYESTGVCMKDPTGVQSRTGVLVTEPDRERTETNIFCEPALTPDKGKAIPAPAPILIVTSESP
jgi:hypothetical protein